MDASFHGTVQVSTAKGSKTCQALRGAKLSMGGFNGIL